MRPILYEIRDFYQNTPYFLSFIATWVAKTEINR